MNLINSVEEYDALLNNNASVFVDFYADWCGPCKMLGPVVEQVARENSDVQFAKVNIDALPEIAERYGIMSIPTLLSFKGGKQVGSGVGFMPKESVQEIVNKAK